MKVLVCDRYNQNSLAQLEAENFTVVTANSLQPTAQELQSIEALLVRSKTQVNKKLLEQAPHLKLVVTATSGFNHIDAEACDEKNVQVLYTPEANVESAAQHTLLLALSLLRQSYRGQKLIAENQWKHHLSPGRELSSLQWGIIGYGRIGRRLNELLQVFNIKTVAYDPYVDSFKNTQAMGLMELLRTSEIISLHVPLTSETQNMINHKTLENICDGTYLINTSRGEVIDDNALISALKDKRIAGAGLDVFNSEPLPQDSQLRDFENLILTPHIGAYTEEALQKASDMACHKVIQFFKNNEVTDPLPTTAAWYRFFLDNRG